MKYTLVALAVVLAGAFVAVVRTSTPSCNSYFDVKSSTDGNGSLTNPFNNLPSHINSISGVACLRSGNYLQNTLNVTASNLTIEAYPSETAMVQSTGQGVLNITGNNVSLINLIIDNNGASGPGIALRGDHLTLQGNDIRNGSYNGIDVRGSFETIVGNKIHNFDSSPTDAECVQVFTTANHLKILKNQIHDCSGNGIELYATDITIGSSNDVLIDGNILTRGVLAHSETLIGLKHGNYVTITNNLMSGTADYNWAMGARGVTKHVIMANNILRGNYTGVELGALNGSLANDILVTHNLIDNTGGPQLGQSGGGFGVEVSGCISCSIIGNTIIASAYHSIFFEGGGLQGGTIKDNLLYSTTSPYVFPGGIFTNVAFSHNGWWNTNSTFLASSNDVNGNGNPGFIDKIDYKLSNSSVAAGLGWFTQQITNPTPTSTPTSTKLPTPTNTPTPIPTATDTPTQTPTITDTPIPTDTPTAISTATPTPALTDIHVTETATPQVVNNCQVQIYNLQPLDIRIKC